MSNFIKIENSVVTQMIVAEKEFFDAFVDSSPGEWIDLSLDGTFRKNYVGIGYTYNSTLDAFIPPKPYNSWTLNEDTCQWEPPVPMPEEGQYMWDESTTSWVEVTV